jgi:hypothetical protein
MPEKAVSTVSATWRIDRAMARQRVAFEAQGQEGDVVLLLVGDVNRAFDTVSPRP